MVIQRKSTEEFENPVKLISTKVQQRDIEGCSNIAVTRCSWCKKSYLKYFFIEYHYCNE